MATDAATALYLKRLRQRHGYASQQKFADALNVSRSAVGNWETGRNIPDMDTAERIVSLTGEKRADVMARLGYPIGGGPPAALPALPPEWLAAIREEIAAGVAAGLSRALDDLRDEGLLGTPPQPGGGPPQRRTA